MDCNCEKCFSFKWSAHVRKYNQHKKVVGFHNAFKNAVNGLKWSER